MNQNNTKKRIISSTIKLIIKKGIKDTTLSDIAKACNISKGTLYYYYSSKDKLISDIANIHLDAITNGVLECILEENNQEDMISSIIKKTSKISIQSKIHIYILAEAINSNDELKNQIKIKYDHWRKTLNEELKKHLKDENDAKSLSFILICIVDGILVQTVLNNKKEINYENIANFLVNNFK